MVAVEYIIELVDVGLANGDFVGEGVTGVLQ